jgi:glycosyltransferase involved in cell wall biosynthesis
VRKYRWDTLKTTLSFMVLFLRNRRLEVVAHEIPFLAGKQGWLYKWKWKLAPRLIFHTSTELELSEKRYGMRLSRDRVEIRTHHALFNRFSNETRASARERLGIDQRALVFLCIGFLQRHKGFHRAIAAFNAAGQSGAELYLVGSIRVPHPDNTQYVSELRSLVANCPGTHLVESFVSNEEFDTWITAADWVVFPYAEIWSSGVLARTRLLERPAIVSAVGGLPEQVGERDLLFQSDEELASAFRTAAESTRSGNSGKHRRTMLSEQER